MHDPPKFLFITCQVGAERAVKRELARRWPDFRFAFSRPGFLTFKLPENHGLAADFDLESVFARSYGFSLGKAAGGSPQELAEALWGLYGPRPVRRVLVCQRDAAEPGAHGFEVSITPDALEARQAILACPARAERLEAEAERLDDPPGRGQFVLDCVVVEPDEWWVGYHRVRRVASSWPGGILALPLPEATVSRAWLKMEEALRWSRLPVEPGARCVELGSAPGGASQALLSRGLIVTGVDPADMAEAVVADPNFTHLRRRVREVPRREFRKTRWLTADLNAAPNYTLDAVESIVTARDVNIRGMLLTLKLTEWKLADRMPEYLQRVRGWGFNQVHARQLASNRQEVCVSALKRPFRRRTVPENRGG